MSPLPQQPSAGRACALAVALLVAAGLSGCGGAGEAPAQAEAAGPAADAALQADHDGGAPPSGLEGRRFRLWSDIERSAVQAEQAALDPAQGGNRVRLIVRLNPAAALQSDRRAMLGSGAETSSGEGGDDAARRAQRIAARAGAVAQATQSVLSRSVLQQAPDAQVLQHYAHALEAFVLSVPFSDAERVADALAGDPAVDSVEPDRLLHLEQTTPTSRTLDARAWGVDRIDQRLRSFDQRFHSAYTGAGVSVYVLDTGINTHSQFGSRLRTGYTAIADGRGTRDCHGHGTHVAGTAAGATMGVAPDADVVPVRVLDCQGRGSSSLVLAGMDWVAAWGSRPGVVNMSLGGPDSPSLDAGARRLLTAGFSVVAAAGNSRVDACTQSPASTLGVLTVAATDAQDHWASYSNWGGCVVLSAPGSQIGSAGIASADAVATLSGTSMAAPHVAGAAALVLQAQPAATAAQVLEHLRQQATPNGVTGAPAGTPRGLLYAGSDTSVVPPPPSLPSVRSDSLSIGSRVPSLGRWSAQTVVRVVNHLGQPVAKVRVQGRYSNMASDLSCTTASDGRCTFNSAAATWGVVREIGFAITKMTASGMAYSAEGPSRAQVAQPAAPVATVTALSGTMIRPSAASSHWRPRFTVTLRDTGQAGVATADVQALVTVYRHSQPAAQRALRCRTNTAGSCILDWNGATVDGSHTGATVQIQQVSRAFLVYNPGPITSATLGRVN